MKYYMHDLGSRKINLVVIFVFLAQFLCNETSQAFYKYVLRIVEAEGSEQIKDEVNFGENIIEKCIFLHMGSEFELLCDVIVSQK